MPVRARVPDCVVPCWQYAVAVTRSIEGVAAKLTITAAMSPISRRIRPRASNRVPPHRSRSVDVCWGRTEAGPGSNLGRTPVRPLAGRAAFAAEPAEEHHHDDRRDERAPPRVQAERAE